MESCNLFRLLLELLQTVHLVIEELLDCSGVCSFQLLQDVEHHVEFRLGYVRLIEHVFQGT